MEVVTLKYTFMHKNIQILDMEMDDRGYIEKICNLYNVNHLPVGIHLINGIVNRGELNDWFRLRSIPASRKGIEWALQQLNISSTQELLVRSFGLSLSDQYWIKPFEQDLKWDDINFFYNDFSEDIGDLLFGIRDSSENISFISPDNTSDGNLKKRWKIINGDRYLLKSGSGALKQEIYNEVLASRIMDSLNINHIEYRLLKIDDESYSICKDFVNDDEDLVPIFRFINQKKMSQNDSSFTHLIKLLEEYNVPNYRKALDQMLVIDYLIANEDRHYNNFGLIRDVNTLEYKGFAPIYDNGCSLGYSNEHFGEAFNPKWKPFMTNKIQNQLELVSSFDWLDLNKLAGIELLVDETYPNTDLYLKRKVEIVQLIKYRINKIKEYIKK